jgi:HK97 family phage prohead protease
MPRFTASDGSKTNTKGYRVDLSGGRFDRFNANPVMLYEHETKPVIGKWSNLAIEDNKLGVDPVFDEKDPLGAKTKQQVDDGFLRGASMGILPITLDYINGEFVMTEWELMEISICAIPSDAGAVVLYNEKMEKLTFEEVKENLGFTIDKNNINNFNETKMGEEKKFQLSVRTLETLKLDSDYTAKDVELAVAEKDKKIQRLTADLEAIKKQTQADYLTAAVKAGKITEQERLAFDKMCDKGCFDDVKAMIDAKAEKPSASLNDMMHQSNLSAGREDWDYLKWMKEDPKGLEKIRSENPKEFERLQKTIQK